MSDNGKFCIESEIDDSKYFGSSSSYGGGVAINDLYIVVTDPENNRIIV